MPIMQSENKDIYNKSKTGGVKNMSERKERKCEKCGGSMGYMSNEAYVEIGTLCDLCIEGGEE